MPPGDTGAEPAIVALAREAIARAMAAVAEQDTTTALLWIERARRLVPTDPNVALTLASLCVNTDPARAEVLFASVAAEYDVRQAWLGLATVKIRTGDPAAAAEPMARVLSCHAFDRDSAALADRIAPAGWCALRPDGTLEIHPKPKAPTTVTLDGRPVAAKRLPKQWERCQTVEIMANGAHLLGSPIRIAAIRRTAGCVEARDGGLLGWAWHPNDPATDPVLTLTDRHGRERTIAPADESIAVADTGPLARPRSFSLSAADLRDMAGPIRISGPDGRELAGSPVDPDLESTIYCQAALRIGRDYPAAHPPCRSMPPSRPNRPAPANNGAAQPSSYRCITADRWLRRVWPAFSPLSPMTCGFW